MKKRIVQLALVIFYILLTGLTAIAQDGKIVRITVHSLSLEGNLLGDSPDRAITIYLPPSYDNDPVMRYPAVYLLHGYGGNNEAWTGGYAGNILTAMKPWLAEKKVKEMIIVVPDSRNLVLGSYYNNSAAGKWADFIAKDLVNHIDKNYRTLPQRESRAIVGHSMGGNGGFTLGIFYPKVFGCMGGFAGDFYFDNSYMENYKRDFATASTIKAWSQTPSINVKWVIGICSGYVPNSDNPPFYCDFPFKYKDDGSGEIIKNQVAYDMFLSYNAVDLAEKNLEALLSMRAIYINCGTKDDPFTLVGCRKLHEKLDNLNVKHIYEEFEGDHMCCVMNSTGNALEVFSKAMSFEMLTGVEPKGKLTTTWGQIRQKG